MNQLIAINATAFSAPIAAKADGQGWQTRINDVLARAAKRLRRARNVVGSMEYSGADILIER